MEFNAEAVEKELDLYLKTYATTYAKKGMEMITSLASEAIALFYEDYNPPKYYHRTEDLLENSFSSYFHNNNKQWRGGVRIHSDKMRDYTHGHSTTPASTVVEWTWMSGYHGYRNHDIHDPIFTFPPYLMITDYIRQPSFRKELDAAAKSAALSHEYKYLDFE